MAGGSRRDARRRSRSPPRREGRKDVRRGSESTSPPRRGRSRSRSPPRRGRRSRSPPGDEGRRVNPAKRRRSSTPSVSSSSTSRSSANKEQERERTPTALGLLMKKSLDDPTLDEGERRLLEKIKMQSAWFTPPETVDMPPKGAKVEVRKAGAVLGDLEIDGSPYYLMGKDSKVVEVLCEHPSISRVHCAFYCDQEGRCMVVDLGSRHGTTLGGKRLEAKVPVEWKNGVALRLGASTREYVMCYPTKKQVKRQQIKEKLNEALAAAGEKRDDERAREEAKERERALKESLKEEKRLAEEAKKKEKARREAEAELLKKLEEEAKKKEEEEERRRKEEEAALAAARELQEKLREREREKDRIAKEAREAALRAEEERRRAEEEAARRAAEAEARLQEENTISDNDDELVSCRLEVMDEQRATRRLLAILKNPTKEGVTDSDGWVQVRTLLTLPDFVGLTVPHFKVFGMYDAKKRFELRKRAGQYELRSTQVEAFEDTKLQLTPLTEAPEDVLHGTTLKAWKKGIQKEGLSVMKREYIHFTTSEPDEPGMVPGLKRPAEVYIYLNMEKAMAEGIKFFSTEDGTLVCSPGKKGIIKPKYFREVMVVRTQEMLLSNP